MNGTPPRDERMAIYKIFPHWQAIFSPAPKKPRPPATRHPLDKRGPAAIAATPAASSSSSTADAGGTKKVVTAAGGGVPLPSPDLRSRSPDADDEMEELDIAAAASGASSGASSLSAVAAGTTAPGQQGTPPPPCTPTLADARIRAARDAVEQTLLKFEQTPVKVRTRWRVRGCVFAKAAWCTVRVA